MSDVIRVNGNVYSWGSIVLKVADEPLYGFDNLSYSEKRERTKVYGAGKHQAPRGRTRGKYSAEASLAMFKATAQDLRARLAALSPDGVSYGDVEFSVVASYIEADETPITVELLGCVIAEQGSNEGEGADALKEDVKLDVLVIKRNGLTLFDNSDKLY